MREKNVPIKEDYNILINSFKYMILSIKYKNIICSGFELEPSGQHATKGNTLLLLKLGIFILTPH